MLSSVLLLSASLRRMPTLSVGIQTFIVSDSSAAGILFGIFCSIPMNIGNFLLSTEQMRRFR